MTDANVAERLREAARILESIPPNFNVTFPGVVKAIHEGVALIGQAAAQQAAIAGDLSQTATMLETYAPEIFPEVDEEGRSHFGRVMMESAAESIRNAISSLSPRARQLLAVVAANAKWQSSLRASPMDIAGQREGFADLKLALAALYAGEDSSKKATKVRTLDGLKLEPANGSEPRGNGDS